MSALEEMSIDCPYCGEALTVFIDDSAGEQSYYEDCAVCCAPILLTISEDHLGELSLTARRDDD